ncbi:hypothetical protein JOF56_011627 [Kibdelosporangium banguiense]|uniref:Phage portal protein n=1 Tax=Kibdelosporangium banguiense TaxID=1365924 RepID=A0ABS4U3J4_9PSEU|nr:phage portal protein [Kibdelosporangium banguiense]MBP2331242.1 hypothetical protein [Kibdelosporangium banguiense]
MRDVLIEPNTQWPPPGHDRLRTHWESWRAWWSGDIRELKKYTPQTAPGGYWERKRNKPGGREIHLPLASDIARTSGELVAGDTPALDFGDTSLTGQWDDLSQTIGWANRLIEAAEVASPLGGSFLRPAWDDRVADYPLLTVVPGDEALPEFRFGHLWSVVFVEELPPPAGWKAQRSGEVWRHLEHHELGQIRHELWLGSSSDVGRQLPLAEHPSTNYFPHQIDTTPIRPGLLCEYIPNYLPNPLVRLPLGRSDYQANETFFDALDTSWDSWMRDIDLGKNRLLISREMLDPVTQTGGRGGFLGRGRKDTPAKAFDIDAEVFTPLEMPAEDQGKPAPITPVQFKIRYQEHAETVAALIEQIVSRAGYAPQTFGMHVEGQLSGTAMRRREHRSYRTRERKRRYMRPPVERCAETLMLINHVMFSGPKPTKRPTLAWRETDQADPKETAETVNLYRQAKAMSCYIAVAMAHPEWDDVQIKEEVARIEKEEAELMAPPPTGHEPPPGTDPNQPPQQPEDDQ